MIDEILSTVDDTTFGEFIYIYLISFWEKLILHIKLCVLFFSDEESWNDIIVACSSLAAKWKQLSGFMGLSFKTIRTINGNNPDDREGAWNEALMQWILQDYNTEKHGLPSWRTLLRTIGRVDQPLFEKLATEHQAKGMCMHNTPIMSIVKFASLLYSEELRCLGSNMHINIHQRSVWVHDYCACSGVLQQFLLSKLTCV